MKKLKAFKFFLSIFVFILYFITISYSLTLSYLLFSLSCLQLYELSDDAKRKDFLDDLFAFMQKRGKNKSFLHYKEFQHFDIVLCYMNITYQSLTREFDTENFVDTDDIM